MKINSPWHSWKNVELGLSNNHSLVSWVQCLTPVLDFGFKIIICVNIMCLSFQVFGIIFIIGMRAMMDKVSIFGANITLSSFLVFGIILTGINSTKACITLKFCSTHKRSWYCVWYAIYAVKDKYILCSWSSYSFRWTRKISIFCVAGVAGVAGVAIPSDEHDFTSFVVWT